MPLNITKEMYKERENSQGDLDISSDLFGGESS